MKIRPILAQPCTSSETELELGLGYYHGDGVKRNYELSFRWFENAANLNNSDAMFILAYLYTNGIGISKSKHCASVLLKRASMQGHTLAEDILKHISKSDNLISTIFERYTKAKKGLPSGQCMLGVCSYYGINNTPQNYSTATAWFTKAANAGYAYAQLRLGICYENGHGVHENYKEAVHWYKASAWQNNAEAQYKLGKCFYHGHGVEKCYKTAISWYKNAAENKHEKSFLELAYCCVLGHGLKQCFSNTFHWIQKAANAGSPEAQYKLGICYYDGIGVNINYKLALEWHKRASKQNISSMKKSQF